MAWLGGRRNRLEAYGLPHLSVKVYQEARIFLEKFLGVLATLTDPLVPIRKPRSAFLNNLLNLAPMYFNGDLKKGIFSSSFSWRSMGS